MAAKPQSSSQAAKQPQPQPSHSQAAIAKHTQHQASKHRNSQHSHLFFFSLSLLEPQARGAKIYCELAGYAANCDAFHITAPDPQGEGMAYCLETAMASAGVKPEEVDYINAHGTSTPLNDKFETMAFKSVFGEHASKVKISSTKGATGHLLGAAGGIEAAVCAKVLQSGSIPPTINYNTPDPDCDLDYTPNTKYVSETPLNVAISDNLGFGGHNAALVFKRYPSE